MWGKEQNAFYDSLLIKKFLGYRFSVSEHYLSLFPLTPLPSPQALAPASPPPPLPPPKMPVIPDMLFNLFQHLSNIYIPSYDQKID